MRHEFAIFAKYYLAGGKVLSIVAGVRSMRIRAEVGKWLVVGAWWSIVFSQVGLGQGEGRRPDGRGGGNRQVLGGALDLLPLINDESVRKEIGMTQEGFDAVRKVQARLRELAGGAGRGRDDGRQPRRGDNANTDRRGDRGGVEGRAALDVTKVNELNSQLQTVLDEVLDPKGTERLIGLYVQSLGLASAANELVAKRADISNEQIASIKESLQKSREEQPLRLDGAPSTDEITKQLEARRKASDDAVAAILSDAQEKAVNDLRGAEFKLPEIRGGRVGGGDRRGSDRQGGAGGDREGSAGGDRQGGGRERARGDRQNQQRAEGQGRADGQGRGQRGGNRENGGDRAQRRPESDMPQ